MADNPALPTFAAIVVAAGSGIRAGQSVPKQFAKWRGKPLVRHSVKALLAAGASPLVVVIPEGGDEMIATALAGLSRWEAVVGGATRQQSVAHGLAALESAERVLIHDAARPDVPFEVIQRLIDALDAYQGAIPVLEVVDSLVIAGNGRMAGTAKRDRKSVV